jgi:uncharacterized protein (DUF58 family)
VRLTTAGALAAILAAGLLAAAYLLGYPRLAVPAVAGFAALAVSALSVIRRPDLVLERQVFPARVTRGEPAVALLTAVNRARWSGVQVDVREAFCDTELPVPLPFIPRAGRREVGYPLPTGRRGVHTVGPLRWQQSGSFGFFLREQAKAQQFTLFVHPVTHQVPLGAVLRAQRWDSSTTDAALDGTITFHRLREYVPGDALRLIHWRSSARLDKLVVRHNIDVSLPQTTIILVTDPASYPEQELFEEAVEIAASAAVASATAGLPVSLRTTDGTTLNGGGSLDDPRLLLDGLAGVTMASGAGLPEVARRLEQAQPGGTLVAVAGVLDEAAADVLSRLALRYDEAVCALLTGRRGNGHGDWTQRGDRSLTVIPAESAAQFCARWSELARR